MAAADGAFDETSEVVTVDVDTTLLSPGSHTFCVLATDAEDNATDGTDCVTWTLRAVGGGGGSGGDDDDDDEGSSDDDDDDGEGGSSALPTTGATDSTVTAGLGGLVAIAVGGMLLVKTRMRPQHRA
jgi:LPXTG-motif cell wall-anchored protein